MPTRALVVDLNNFSLYPTLAVGYLAAALRQSGHEVSVFAPLMVGVGGVRREAPHGAARRLLGRFNHLAATSSIDAVRVARGRLTAPRLGDVNREAQAVLQAFACRLDDERPQVVLVSAYLMYRDLCASLARLCRERGIPVLLGGPYFAQEATARNWAQIEGVSAVATGELDLVLGGIVAALGRGERLRGVPGIVGAAVDAGSACWQAAPLDDLDRLPVPDFRDYPWSLYPRRIVPVITGRGCGWGRCGFCSDITSTAGRSFRSRSLRHVLDEIGTQHARHGATHFVFADLKLNSSLEVWRGLSRHLRDVVPGATWIGSMHVGPEPDNGLSPADFEAAARSGCVRLTTGLETGSARMATVMRKGTRPEAIGRALRDAAGAGLSCRCTLIMGHPGETAADLLATAQFLEAHSDVIERVSVNRLQVIAGTALHHDIVTRPSQYPTVRILRHDEATALVDHHDNAMSRWAHRRAAWRVMDVADRINARPLGPRARDFEGAM